MGRKLVLSLVIAVAAGCGTESDTVSLDSSFVCEPRPDDGTGYLKAICDHIVASFDEYPVDPNTLDVVGLVSGEDWTASASPYADGGHVFVGLSCCFTGDWAVVERGSSDVVDFVLGDK